MLKINLQVFDRDDDSPGAELVYPPEDYKDTAVQLNVPSRYNKLDPVILDIDELIDALELLKVARNQIKAKSGSIIQYYS